MCATGYGIRRSKDLRARFRKFLNLTNERKNMSTKTNFKRVALVAVASLGLGVLTSVAPAFAAPSLTVSANGGTATDSRGIVTSPTGTTGLTNTAKMLASGSLYVTAGTGAATGALAVSGGSITACSGGTVVLAATGSTCYNGDTTALVVTVVPTAGASVMTISQYASAAYATESVRLTVSIVAATTVGAYSSAESFIEVTDAAVTADDNVDDKYSSTGFYDATYGATTMTTRINGGIGYISFVLKDGNRNQLPATTVLSATATGGCLVGFGGATTRLSGSAAGTYDGTSGYLSIAQAAANTPYKCVVTLAANGATIATRTFTLQGQVTKLVVSDIMIAKSAATTTGGLYVDAQDASGNSVPDVSVAPDTTTYNTSVSTISSGTTNVMAGTALDVTCDAKGSNAGLKLKATNASVATIRTDAFTVLCAGTAVNYTAGLDKATYSIGEVATLTITAKDSAGNLTWDGLELGKSTTAATASANAVSIAGGPMTQVGSIVSTDSFTSGVKKYKFTVGGISSGSFNLVVDLPRYNGTTYNQSAVSVAYKVTTGSDAGVSNADVLKAIVSLIASINKQIAALQKALLKK